MCGYFFLTYNSTSAAAKSAYSLRVLTAKASLTSLLSLSEKAIRSTHYPRIREVFCFFLPGHSTPHSTFYSNSHLNQHLIQFHFTRHSTSISISFHTSLNIQFHLYFILFKADNSLCTRQKAVGTHVNKRCMLWTIRKSDHTITYPICVTT